LGANFAQELAFAPEMGMETAIRLHLTQNHYPPVPVSMVSVCIEAIDAYWEEDLNRQVELPEGILWRGESSAPAYAIIESHHLDFWCMEGEE